jgi:pseudouridine-5'-phosphate glycosidase
MAGRRPVLALESSIVAQGFPHPENLELAHEMEAAVRGAGAVPAQVALLDGTVRVGLGEAEIERLARPGAMKCSSRDIAYALTQRLVGATTVAATARIASLLGIRVFATGGIGGVHPGEGGRDISADLAELSRCAVAVVCSGAKSILDLAATLEALEALGVPVIGVGTDRFPAFHAADSGLALGRRIDRPEALAELMAAHWAVVPDGGLLFCQPPPAAQAIGKAELDALVARALAEAAAANVGGQALTPYLLDRLNRLSGGRTLRVNRALALANARLGAEIAVAWARRRESVPVLD